MTSFDLVLELGIRASVANVFTNELIKTIEIKQQITEQQSIEAETIISDEPV